MCPLHLTCPFHWGQQPGDQAQCFLPLPEMNPNIYSLMVKEARAQAHTTKLHTEMEWQGFKPVTFLLWDHSVLQCLALSWPPFFFGDLLLRNALKHIEFPTLCFSFVFTLPFYLMFLFVFNKAYYVLVKYLISHQKPVESHIFDKSFYGEDTAETCFLIGGMDLKSAPGCNKPKVENVDILDIMCGGGGGGSFCLTFS